ALAGIVCPSQRMWHSDFSNSSVLPVLTLTSPEPSGITTYPLAWYSTVSGVKNLVARKIVCVPTFAVVRHFENLMAVVYVCEEPAATEPLALVLAHFILMAPSLNSCSDSLIPCVAFVVLEMNSCASAGAAPNANAHMVARSPKPNLRCLITPASPLSPLRRRTPRSAPAPSRRPAMQCSNASTRPGARVARKPTMILGDKTHISPTDVLAARPVFAADSTSRRR